MTERQSSIVKRRRYPSFLEAFFGPEEFFPEVPFSEESGLSLSEDDKNFFVEASLPGLSSKDIQVHVEKGTLWIKGENTQIERNKERKFYKKARNTFSYYLTLPENVDLNQEPQATTKNGVMTITFNKKESSEPRRIQVKEG